MSQFLTPKLISRSRCTGKRELVGGKDKSKAQK